MGPVQSKEYNLPSGKNYSFSYCKQLEIKSASSNARAFTDLSNLINFENNDCAFNENIIKLIYSAIKYKITNLGYTINPCINLNLNLNKSLKDNLETIINYGFYNNQGDFLSDLIIKKQCYKSDLNTIFSLISSGNILVGGIIIDQELIDYLDIKLTIDKLISDIILIIGFTEECLILKTNWKNENIYLKFEFIDNIKELWNFKIKSPEINLNEEDK